MRRMTQRSRWWICIFMSVCMSVTGCLLGGCLVVVGCVCGRVGLSVSRPPCVFL